MTVQSHMIPTAATHGTKGAHPSRDHRGRVELIARGRTRPVEAAAARAGVGRGTAYRHFPISEPVASPRAHPVATARSMLPPDVPATRWETCSQRRGGDHPHDGRGQPSPVLRTMLRLSLAEGADRPDLPLRRRPARLGRAKRCAAAGRCGRPALIQALTLALAATCGIEVYVRLKDVAGLDPDERWPPPPPPPPPKRRVKGAVPAGRADSGPGQGSSRLVGSRVGDIRN